MAAGILMKIIILTYMRVEALLPREKLGNTERSAPKLIKFEFGNKNEGISCLVRNLGNSKRSAPKLN